MGKRAVLVLNANEELFAKVAPLLDSDQFEVNRFPRAAMAREIIGLVAFDVLLVTYPLPDIHIQDFLDSVRGEGSKCRRSPLLLIAPHEHYDEASEFVGRGANRVVSLEESAEQLQEEVRELLHVAARHVVKFIVRMSVVVDDKSQLEICQTENMSESGMLVHSNQSYEIGSDVSFEFYIGDDLNPIKGTGIVARKTIPDRESVQGIGVRFLDFERNGQQRLRDHLGS